MSSQSLRIHRFRVIAIDFIRHFAVALLGKIEDDFRTLGCKVCILKEENGEIVDDCIGAVLGGRGRYLEILKSCKGVGTFFLTPMWVQTGER